MLILLLCSVIHVTSKTDERSVKVGSLRKLCKFIPEASCRSISAYAYGVVCRLILLLHFVPRIAGDDDDDYLKSEASTTHQHTATTNSHPPPKDDASKPPPSDSSGGSGGGEGSGGKEVACCASTVPAAL